MRSVPIVAAATGAATFAALVRLAPGSGAGRPVELIAAVTDARWYVTVAALTLLLLFARLLAHRRDAAAFWHCGEPVLLGAGAPLASLVLDPWLFHGSVYVTTFAGLALGVLGSWSRARGLPACRRPSDRQAVLLLAALTIGIPTFLALPGPPWFHPVSGDEPHYLVIARSIWLDHDVDVSNDYRGSLLPFWYGELPPHDKPGADAATRYSIHGSGLALWLAPWYGLGRGLSEAAFNALVRFAMTLWLAAGAVALFYLLRDVAGPRVALPGAALAVLTLPLLFAGAHLFPAVPVFALSCGAYVLLRGGGAGGAALLPGASGSGVARHNATAGPQSGGVSAGRALLAGMMLAYLPWLHFKFFGLMAAVGAAGFWFMRRSRAGAGSARPAGRRERAAAGGAGTRHRLALASLAAPLLLSGLGHLAFTWRLYGRLSPLAIHVGADPTRRATAAGGDWLAYLADPLGAATTFIGYFLDQREGLLFYAPHYLLAVAGFAWLWRRRRADAVALAAALLAVAGPYALSQETGHWAPPARPLTGALWTLAAAMGVGLALPAGDGRRGKLRAALRAVLVAWGAGATVLLLLQPDLLYHDYNVGRSLVLLRYGSPGLPLAELAPLWLGPDAVRWGVSLVGLAVTLGLGVWLWRWGSEAAVTAPELPAAAAVAGIAGERGGVPLADGAPGTAIRPPAAAGPILNSGAGAIAPRAAAAFIVLAALVLLAHHAWVPISALHESWNYDLVRFWKAESPPMRAWGEPDGLWSGGHDTVNLVLSSREPIAEVVLELHVLAPMPADVQLGRDRQTFRLNPEQRALARMQPGPGARWNGQYFYQLEVVAHGSVSRAALGLDDDSRGLGVRLRVLQVAAAPR